MKTTEVSASCQGGFHFGLEKSRVSGMLRALANDIDQGKAIPKHLDQVQKSCSEDYEESIFTLVIVQSE